VFMIDVCCAERACLEDADGETREPQQYRKDDERVTDGEQEAGHSEQRQAGDDRRPAPEPIRERAKQQTCQRDAGHRGVLKRSRGGERQANMRYVSVLTTAIWRSEAPACVMLESPPEAAT